MQEEKTRNDNDALDAGRAGAIDLYALMRRVLTEGAYVGGGFLFGRAQMLFGTSPLGFALLCACSRHTLSVLLGLLLSTVLMPTVSYVSLIAYSVAAIVRILSQVILDSPDDRRRLSSELEERLRAYDELQGGTSETVKDEGGFWNTAHAILSVAFNERVKLRMATASVCAFIVSFYRIVSGGMYYYDWFAAVFTALTVISAVVVFSPFLDGNEQYVWMHRLSGGFLLFSLIWSANGYWLGILSLPLLLAMLLTLMVSERYGGVLGCLAGVICGLAISFSLVPAFLMAALVFALVRQKKPTAGVFPAILSASVWTIYVSGVSYLVIVLPSLLTAGAIYALIGRLFCTQASDGEATEVPEGESGCLVCEQRHKSTNENLRNISEAFSSLSEMLYNLSDRFRRPGTLDLRYICDRAFDASCSDCPSKAVCWGLEYVDTLGVINSLIGALHTKGRVTGEEITSHLAARCPSVDSILELINRDCARLTGELLRNNRTEIFAMDYEAAASIINDALEEDDAEYSFDSELEQKVSEYLRDAGIAFGSVTVFGHRRRRILVKGACIDRSTVTAETLRCDLGEMCGVALGLPTFEIDGGACTMILQAEKKIRVHGAKNNISADGGVSGDSVNLFSNKKDYFYALINDGMGSGREAALTSNLCSVFLEKMLRAGNRAQTSIRMLNNMIRSRGSDSVGECSSTVDLLEVDLMTGGAFFIKSGAAPSFIVRGQTVHRLQAGTPPIGIISNPDTRVQRFALKEGDVVVMVSDGIEQNDPDCKHLISYLSTVGEMTPEEIVYEICVQASQGDHHDDCSALAMRIELASETD